MVAIDYLVMTFMEVNTVSAAEPQLRKLVRGSEPAARYGYRGHQGLQSFFGYSPWSHRFMLVLSGGYADECAPKIDRNLDTYASVARIDVQATFRVTRADEFIQKLERNKKYRATRIIPEDGSGQTMYIGSRKSNLFCRAYNKSAEAELPPDKDGEFCRVEFCLRDDYADAVWKKFRLGSLDDVFSSLVQRMFAETSAVCILDRARVPLSQSDLDLLRRDEYDWRERRLAWLEGVVAPSVIRLLAEAPWLSQRVWEILDNIPNPRHTGE